MCGKNSRDRPTDAPTVTDDVTEQAAYLRVILASLPAHHKLLYSIIAEAGTIQAGELHERYESIAEEFYRDRDLDPVGARSRRYHLVDLRECGLVAYAGSTHHRRYWATDVMAVPIVDLDDLR